VNKETMTVNQFLIR